MTNKILVLTSAGSQSEAQKIAQELVERRQAACVNIVPRIQSIYRWQGKVESAEEYLLVIKTTQTHVSHVQSTIHELHSYELPEFVLISVEGGSTEYLNWIDESVR